ncbi:MAG TPA: AmmeMemoRadiSam system protein B, partial [Anaerolineales bacterium]|nr:AmmeMemoRadiSam system protein B [Anaerolineales bacterium]
MSEQGIRPSPISGLWYEGNPQLLAQMIDGYLDDARLPDLKGKVVAVMSPHAGHIYSGSVAGYAFAPVRGMSPELVVVIGPMHHPYSGSIIVSTHDAYSTPLGNVPVDQKIIHQLDLTLMEDFHTPLTPIN